MLKECGLCTERSKLHGPLTRNEYLQWAGWTSGLVFCLFLLWQVGNIFIFNSQIGLLAARLSFGQCVALSVFAIISISATFVCSLQVFSRSSDWDIRTRVGRVDELSTGEDQQTHIHVVTGNDFFEYRGRAIRFRVGGINRKPGQIQLWDLWYVHKSWSGVDSIELVDQDRRLFGPGMTAQMLLHVVNHCDSVEDLVQQSVTARPNREQLERVTNDLWGSRIDHFTQAIGFVTFLDILERFKGITRSRLGGIIYAMLKEWTEIQFSPEELAKAHGSQNQVLTKFSPHLQERIQKLLAEPVKTPHNPPDDTPLERQG